MIRFFIIRTSSAVIKAEIPITNAVSSKAEFFGVVFCIKRLWMGSIA